MEPVKVIVPGKPQGKARARTGYNPIAKRVTSHTPENTVLYENLIKTCYINQAVNSFRDGQPLAVRITAYFEPLKSESKKRKEQMLAGETLPTKKPDIDNIAKAVLDALNGLAYRDDNQVVALEVSKKYAEQAKVVVEIKSLDK